MTIVEAQTQGQRHTLLYRAAEEEEPKGSCYDLLVEDLEGSVLLKDIARSRRLAEKILRVFVQEKVGSIEAEYVMEDLLSMEAYIE